MKRRQPGAWKRLPASLLLVVAAVPALVAAGVELAEPRLTTRQPVELSVASQVDATLCQVNGPTPTQTEGPFYKANTPERTSLLEPDMAGTPIVLTGRVLTTGCQPVAGAWLDFWQSDANGAYDNRGFRLRGHQYTDADGQYWLQTIVPAEYPGRTPHIHVKVQAPGGRVITTQLYLPDAPRNARDSIFNPSLTMTLQEGPDSLLGHFDFIVPT